MWDLMGERFLIWKWLYCQISWSEHSEKRFRLGNFLADKLSSRPFIMAFVSNSSGDILWRKQFDDTIRVLCLCSCRLVLAECGRVMWGIRAAGSHGTMGRWLGEVGAMPQTAQFRLIGDWRRLSISFPLLSRPKLGRDSWHHVDTQNRDMECESCLICVLKE